MSASLSPDPQGLKSTEPALSVDLPCSLCGLPVGNSHIIHNAGSTVFRFCCHGCQQVFLLLSAASGVLPEGFQDTDLYRVCIESGIIPTSQSVRQKMNPRDAVLLPPLEMSCSIEGMWCPSCAWLIDEVLGHMAGIVEAKVSFVADRLHLTYLPHIISPQEIITRTGKLGYRLIIDGGDQGEHGERYENSLPLAVSAFLTANIMMASVFFYGFFPLSPAVLRGFSYPVFFMASFVIFWAGLKILKRGIASFFYGAPSMDTLIVIGALSAYLYSLIHMATGGYHLYFDTAAMLITLVLFGRYIETRARRDIRAGMANLYRMAKHKVRCVRPPYETWLAADKIKPGEHFKVLAEEMVPLDGRIIEGNPVIDESFLTGEAKPQRKNPGDTLYAGSTLRAGQATLETVRDAKESFIGQIAATIENALEKKGSYERLADRLSRFFVPIIITLSIGTGFFVWTSGSEMGEALLRGLTVLFIACPCTLGIAIPLAKVSAISIAQRSGIIIRDPDAFERLRGIDTVIFDKTGTVTEGTFSLRHVVCSEAARENLFPRLASLEIYSRHFIAAEIISEANKTGIPLMSAEDVKANEGLGISGKVSGSITLIGNRAFMEQNGIIVDDGIDDEARSWEQKGNTCTFFAWDRRIQGFLIFGDTIRQGIHEMISRLKNKGMEIWLVSGDAEATTAAIAELLTINHSRGHVLPQGKIELVRSLQKQGRRVAMVGDGMNDTPALAAADVSCAFGAGANLIRETGDLAFLDNDPAKLVAALHLSWLSNRTIRQNLVFAFWYNIIAIPVAMLGFLNPFIAVFAMVGSSLTVTGNALRMSRKNLPEITSSLD